MGPRNLHDLLGSSAVSQVDASAKKSGTLYDIVRTHIEDLSRAFLWSVCCYLVKYSQLLITIPALASLLD